MSESLLVVVREHALRFAIQRFFEARAVAVDVCAAGAAFTARAYDAVLVDHTTDEDAAARSIVAACRAANRNVVVVLLLADGDGADFPANVVCRKPLPLDELARHLGVGVKERT